MLWSAWDTETQRGQVAVSAIARADGVHSLVVPSGRRVRVDPVDVFAQLVDWGEDVVAWNADYDIRAILKGLPDNTLDHLAVLTRAEFEGFRLRYVPGKFLDISRKGTRVSVYDLRQFFGSSLDSAASKWLGENKLALSPELIPYLQSGRMGSAFQIRGLRDEIVRYCIRDAALTARLADLIAESLSAISIENRRYTSPASIARKYWGNGVAGRTPKDLQERAWHAYRGGRIEVLSRGMHRGVSHWDLHSAYPSAMVGMPSLQSCHVIRGGTLLLSHAQYALIHCTVRFPRGLRAYPVGVLHKGVMIYPSGSWETVLDMHTFRLAQSVGTVDVHRVDQWVLGDGEPEYPFARMREFYAQRKKKGPEAAALKLLINSTYGLLAERVTHWKKTDTLFIDTEVLHSGLYERVRGVPGSLSCPVIAAHVTGLIRARLYRETWDLPVLSYMTDGVLMPTGFVPSGPIGDGLGEWGIEMEKGDALIVGAGVYAERPDGVAGWSSMTRGFRGFDLVAELRADRSARVLSRVGLEAQTLTEAYARGKGYHRMNVLTPARKFLDLDFDQKRSWRKKSPNAGNLLDGNTGSFPLIYFP